MYTVYLVDDDQLSIDKLQSRSGLFLESGFEISGTQTDPVRALAEIRDTMPDAVLCDLKMPVMTGIQLFEELSNDVSKPLFVIISAYQEFKDVRKFFLIYGFDYLVKPVEDKELTELLDRMAFEISGELPIINRTTASEKLNEIINYIETFPHMTHTLDSIGERYTMKPGAICNLFARHLNTTFSAYVNVLRMRKAEELLIATTKPVKEIAAKCGFTDALYFTRVFTSIYELSPTHYRLSRGWEPEKAEEARGY